MEEQTNKRGTSVFPLYLTIVLLCTGLTAIIGLTAWRLSSQSIIGPTKPFHYPWRLTSPTYWSHLTAWLGYALHNIGAWVLIAFAKRSQSTPRYTNKLRWFNWAMIGLHLLCFGLHWVQTHVWYDGLAQSVPEVTALGSVALMLMVILILETPRRGLIFGKKVAFHKRFLQIVKEYHGYLFTWALIYTFWYHPMEATWGHLVGFFYIFLLISQSALLFHRAHLNKWWTLSLELLVRPHGAIVAYYQGKGMWPMFAFGFGAMFVLTQIYGLGWSRLTRRLWTVGFLVAAVGVYASIGKLEQIHAITRIPVLDYMVVGLLYLLFLAGHALFGDKEATL
jgi:hypothetical protein